VPGPRPGRGTVRMVVHSASTLWQRQRRHVKGTRHVKARARYLSAAPRYLDTRYIMAVDTRSGGGGRAAWGNPGAKGLARRQTPFGPVISPLNKSLYQKSHSRQALRPFRNSARRPPKVAASITPRKECQQPVRPSSGHPQRHEPTRQRAWLGPGGRVCAAYQRLEISSQQPMHCDASPPEPGCRRTKLQIC